MSISMGVDESAAQDRLSGKDTDPISMPRSSERKMQRIGMGALAALVVALAALISLAARARAQTALPAPNSYALAHSVVVIGPNSPMFDTLLERWFPGVTSVQYFSQLKPLLAIVHNNTKRSVKAYVVKWTITGADGTASTAWLHVVGNPAPDEARLPGTETVLGPAGTGLGTQLVSPLFHWPRRGFSPANAQPELMADARLEPLVRKGDNAASVHATLDGVVFGDGVFVGPDTSGLYERFQADQRARVDEATWMLGVIKSGTSLDQIKTQLSKQIYDGRNATGSDPASLYKAARGRAAEGFLAVLEQLGEGYVGRISALLSVSKPMVLQRSGAK